MNFKNIYLIFFQFLKARYNFKKIRKKSIVIYNEDSSQLIADFLDSTDYYILDTSLKYINFRILLKSFIKYNFKWKPKFYFYTFLSELSPSYIITMVDNDLKFWNIKKYIKNTETILIQNGWRDNLLDIFSKLSPREYNSFNVDQMFLFSKKYEDLYKKYIIGKTHTIGSMRSNKFEYSKNTINEVIFISTVKKFDEELIQLKPVQIVFPLLCKIFKEKKIKFKVLGRTLPIDPSEEKFYRNMSNDFTFINKSKEAHKCYKYIDECRMVISIDSTLGYESLSRGNRTAFFSIRGEDLENKSTNFGWPNKFDDLGPFWTNIYNEDYVEKIIDYLLNVSDEEWNKIIAKYNITFMPFDKGNKIFKKYINEVKFNN
jgi:surface carbohydrate biosynthesis protein